MLRGEKREGGSEGLGELGLAIFNRVIGEVITEKVTFDKNLQWKGVSHSDVWGQSILERGSNRCKCPEVGLCFRDGKGARVAGVSNRERGREGWRENGGLADQCEDSGLLRQRK